MLGLLVSPHGLFAASKDPTLTDKHEMIPSAVTSCVLSRNERLLKLVAHILLSIESHIGILVVGQVVETKQSSVHRVNLYVHTIRIFL
jgi:hypothetical protein